MSKFYKVYLKRGNNLRKYLEYKNEYYSGFYGYIYMKTELEDGDKSLLDFFFKHSINYETKENDKDDFRNMTYELELDFRIYDSNITKFRKHIKKFLKFFEKRLEKSIKILDLKEEIFDSHVKIIYVKVSTTETVNDCKDFFDRVFYPDFSRTLRYYNGIKSNK